jgi:hypothetical protein
MRQMGVSPANPWERQAIWTETGDAFFPYETTMDGRPWRLRVNDWPDDRYLYTLFIDGRGVCHLESWPDAWSRPRA